MNKYCPSCGAKTFIETDEEDFEMGTKYSCLTCGAQYWMSETEAVEVTVEGAPKIPYSPVKSDMEVMMERVCASLVSQFIKYGTDRKDIVDRWKENEDAFKNQGREAQTITFRRYAPINPPPEGTDQSQGDEK